jgi:hypothetical protein
MKIETRLKIENFFNRIQRNYTLMEWAVMFAVCLWILL